MFRKSTVNVNVKSPPGDPAELLPRSLTSERSHPQSGPLTVTTPEELLRNEVANVLANAANWHIGMGT